MNSSTELLAEGYQTEGLGSNGEEEVLSTNLGYELTEYLEGRLGEISLSSRIIGFLRRNAKNFPNSKRPYDDYLRNDSVRLISEINKFDFKGQEDKRTKVIGMILDALTISM